VLEKGGVRHVGIHDARHTYASMMLRRNVPFAYGQFVPGVDRHHVETLADAIEEARKEPNATSTQPLPARVDADASK
jgi:integrase